MTFSQKSRQCRFPFLIYASSDENKICIILSELVVVPIAVCFSPYRLVSSGGRLVIHDKLDDVYLTEVNKIISEDVLCENASFF